MPLTICSYFATCQFLFNFSLLPPVIATGGLQVETEAIMRLWERDRLLVLLYSFSCYGTLLVATSCCCCFSYILVSATGRLQVETEAITRLWKRGRLLVLLFSFSCYGSLLVTTSCCCCFFYTCSCYRSLQVAYNLKLRP